MAVGFRFTVWVLYFCRLFHWDVEALGFNHGESHGKKTKKK